MKVVIAPDSFKDSLSALKVAQAIAKDGKRFSRCRNDFVPHGRWR